MDEISEHNFNYIHIYVSLVKSGRLRSSKSPRIPKTLKTGNAIKGRWVNLEEQEAIWLIEIDGESQGRCPRNSLGPHSSFYPDRGYDTETKTRITRTNCKFLTHWELYASPMTSLSRFCHIILFTEGFILYSSSLYSFLSHSSCSPSILNCVLFVVLQITLAITINIIITNYNTTPG
jgi:hypothetical protein